MHFPPYWESIMRDNRFWNLEVKMTTHGLSNKYKILALLVLTNSVFCAECTFVALSLGLQRWSFYL